MLKKISTISLSCLLMASSVNLHTMNRHNPFQKGAKNAIIPSAKSALAVITTISAIATAKELFWDTNPNKKKFMLSLTLTANILVSALLWLSLHKYFSKYFPTSKGSGKKSTIWFRNLRGKTTKKQKKEPYKNMPHGTKITEKTQYGSANKFVVHDKNGTKLVSERQWHKKYKNYEGVRT